MSKELKTSVRLGAAVLFSLVLAACGPKKASIAADLTDYKFTPDTWEVPAGAEVTLTVTNTGSVKHEWLLMAAGVIITPPFNEDAVKDSILVDQDVDPGASATIIFTAPSVPGDYEVICGVVSHIELGMVGHLIVK